MCAHRSRLSRISTSMCGTTTARYAFLCLFVLLLARGDGSGQVLVTSHLDGHTPSALAPGAPAGSYPLTDLESINPYNGKLSFNFPLVKVGGRGDVGYTSMLSIQRNWHFDHSVWPPPNPSCGQQCRWDQNPPVDYYMPNYEGEGALPGYSAGVLEWRSSGEGYTDCPPSDESVYYIETLTRLTFTAPDGTQIEFRDALTGGGPVPTPMGGQCYNGFNRGRIFFAGDGSAATFISDTDVHDKTLAEGGPLDPPTGYLFLADGSTYRVVNGGIAWMRDRNGNKVTGTTDPLGRHLTVTPDYQAMNDQISYPGFGGTPRTIKVWYGTLQQILRVTQPTDSSTIMTYYQLFGAANLPSLSNPDFDPSGLVSRLELPDSRNYRFFYNVYAELARVELPTGGAIEYDHDGGLSPGTTGVVNISDPGVYRRVIERRVYRDATNLGSLDSRTIFSRPVASGSDSFVDVATFDAAGNLLSRVRHFYYSNAGDGFFLGHHANAYTDCMRAGSIRLRSLTQTTICLSE